MSAHRVAKTASCLVVAFVLLPSCAGIIWHDSRWPGALVEGNRRPNTVYSCAEVSLAIADSKYCEWAFVNHEGRKLDVDNDVVNVIDAYLANVTSLSSWANIDKQPQYPVPYRVYILTISPIVVMGVPIEKGDGRSSSFGCIEGLGDGCLLSKKLRIPYRFVARPEVQPGSFWFSPDLRTPEQQIPNGAQDVVIPLGSSRLELRSDGNKWEVRRNSQ